MGSGLFRVRLKSPEKARARSIRPKPYVLFGLTGAYRLIHFDSYIEWV